MTPTPNKNKQNEVSWHEMSLKNVSDSSCLFYSTTMATKLET